MNAPDSPMVTLENCEREPIHIPGCVQPHGFLLVIDLVSQTVIQASSNSVEFLGRSLDQVLGRTLSEILGPEQGQLLQAVGRQAREIAALSAKLRHVPVMLQLPGRDRMHQAMVHEHQGVILLEVEDTPPLTEQAMMRLTSELDRIAGDLQNQPDLSAVAQRYCHSLRQLAGLDRVMVYRFDPEWNGEVVGESHRAELDSYLGLHYPASDIPTQARRLYEQVLVRYLPDITYQPVAIEPVLRPDTQLPLDLSFSKLRSVSAMHVQYLSNMGVRGTIVLSLIVEGRLWGLVACHHYSPLQLPYGLRRLMSVSASLLALQISEHEARAKSARREALVAMRSQLYRDAELAPVGIESVLNQYASQLLLLTQSDGLVLIEDGQIASRWGLTLSKGAERTLVEWAVRQLNDRLHAVTETLRSQEDLAKDPYLPCGVLGVRLGSSGTNALLLLRREHVYTVNWAGNPDKAVEISPDGLQLSPRRSFALWQQVRRGRSRPWDEPLSEWWSSLESLSDRPRLRSVSQHVRLLAGAVEHTLDSVCITDAQLEAPGPRIVYVNPGFTKMTGWEPNEVIGLTPRILQGPETDLSLMASVRERLHDGQTVNASVINYRKNGEPFHIEWTIAPIQDEEGVITHYVAVQRDITQRLADQERARLARLVYEHGSEGMLVCDAQGKISSVNPAFAQVTGYSPSQALGQAPIDLLAVPESRPRFHALWQALEARGSWKGELSLRRADGSVFSARMQWNAIPGASSGAAFVGQLADVSQQKAADELIWRQANFDSLTGLPNRALFLSRLDQEVRRSLRSAKGVGLLLIDLDGFKDLNDTYGHQKGDALLTEVGVRLRSLLQPADTPARTGGDEFTVVIPELGSDQALQTAARRVSEALAQPFEIDGLRVVISASIGYAQAPSDARSRDELLRVADQALTAAKKIGRGRIQAFTAALKQANVDRLRMINDLHLGFEQQQLFVVLQPVIHLATGKVFKAEALLRWNHPERGMVSPYEFIPAAEESGLIHPLGSWVLEQALEWAAQFSQAAGSVFQVAVNRSPLQFQQPEPPESWTKRLARHGLPGKALSIEITEGLLLRKEPQVSAQLEALSAAGIDLALDDFGTGYSSMSYLRRFSVDYLKIDQSFVKDIETDEADRAIVEAIIVMAHKLGLHTVAEGVETQAQAEWLQAAGCDYGQGYWFARPMLPQVLLEDLKARGFNWGQLRKLAN